LDDLEACKNVASKNDGNELFFINYIHLHRSSC
jgi:hypothetical protein